MRDHGRRVRRAAARVAFALLILTAAPVSGGDPPPMSARGGLELAAAAARAWQPDAHLVYIENDEPLDGSGAAARWGYLFFSKTVDQSRGYSVRHGKIVVAENLEMKFEAPPLDSAWIDSGVALEAAERGPAREFRQKEGGTLSTMLLTRGAFQDKDPDATTWTLIYASPTAPSLFVVVDAAGGKVRRTWRG